MSEQPDMVNHPPHYKGNRFESIDVIEAYRLGFHLGNAFKYIARHKNKGGRQDIEKAHWYLKRVVRYEYENAFIAQREAWGRNLIFGIAGVKQDEIILDFEIGNYALESAMGAILAAANADSRARLDLVRLARDHVAFYLSATNRRELAK